MNYPEESGYVRPNLLTPYKSTSNKLFESGMGSIITYPKIAD